MNHIKLFEDYLNESFATNWKNFWKYGKLPSSDL